MLTLAFAKLLFTKVITHQLLLLLLGENVQVQHNNQLSKQKTKGQKTIKQNLSIREKLAKSPNQESKVLTKVNQPAL